MCVNAARGVREGCASLRAEEEGEWAWGWEGVGGGRALQLRRTPERVALKSCALAETRPPPPRETPTGDSRRVAGVSAFHGGDAQRHIRANGAEGCVAPLARRRLTSRRRFRAPHGGASRAAGGRRRERGSSVVVVVVVVIAAQVLSFALSNASSTQRWRSRPGISRTSRTFQDEGVVFGGAGWWTAEPDPRVRGTFPSPRPDRRVTGRRVATRQPSVRLIKPLAPLAIRRGGFAAGHRPV